MAELFLSNISYSVNQKQLKHEFANLLHTREYLVNTLGQLPTNFDVRLFPNRRHAGYGHSGNAALTLPSEELAAKILVNYEGPSAPRILRIGNRPIRFQRSNRPPRSEVVETIRRLPYQNPVELEERERRAEQLQAKSVSIRTIQFGWECRDSKLSIEWEKKDYIDACAITFQQDPRELRIKYYAPTETRIIAIRFSQIAWTATSLSVHGIPVISLFLHSPPSFETEVTPERTRYILASQGPKFKGTVYDIEPRQRLSAFDDDHARVAPYASLAIRLICNTDMDVMMFRRLSRIAQLQEPQNYDYPVVYRGLFSAHNMSMLQRWLRDLEFEVAFQVESLTRSLTVDIQEMLSLRGHVESLFEDKGAAYTSALLRHFGVEARKLFWEYNESKESTESLEECFHRSEREYKLQSSSPALNTGDAVFNCLHVTMTPTTVHLDGPFPERSNRVIRSYPDLHSNFLRVSFVDETNLQYRFDREVDGRNFIGNRVGGALLKGISVAGRFFKFLAYSQSALKEHAVWFVKRFLDKEGCCVDAPTIIRNIGSFANLSFDRKLIYCPARYGARLSQAFTATDSSISVEAEEIFSLDDVEVNKLDGSGNPLEGTWCFTDGVGTISRELAQGVWKELQKRTRRGKRIKTYPRALQVRFMGSKGMLSVDYKLSGRAICLRPSMIKFESPESREIEIARAFDKPGNYWLNRPLIMLLEGLGVPYKTFEHYQDIAVREVKESTSSLATAARMLEAYGLGASYRLTSIMLSLNRLGLDNLDDVFYQRSLELAVHHVLRELKQHSRIPVPGAWTLVGVADVHGFLKEGEIFACFINPSSGKTIYLEGPILISRSPTIHPGDVQVVAAIGKPPEGSCFSRERLKNTVVFSIRGSRPLPSCLGGGDLDGDVYNLVPLRELPEFTPNLTSTPALYNAAPKKVLDRPSTMDDVAEFFVDYINNDVLGIIAMNWLIIADQSPDGIFDVDCLKLGDLHSDAVDFPKSGQPVALERIPKLKFRAKPDWNAPETLISESVNFYESSRAIGRLFRSIELPHVQTLRKKAAKHQRQHQEIQELPLDEILADLHLDHADEEDFIYIVMDRHVSQFIDAQLVDRMVAEHVSQLFNRYASDLQSICISQSLTYGRESMLTEEEVIIGTIAAKCTQPRKRKDLMAKLREQTNLLVTGIREDLLGDEDLPLEEGLMRSWMAWRVSATEHGKFGATSFGWVALGAIFEAIKDIEERDERGSRF